uniref:Uncharacterized protein n=1 Tax=Siphoviridae sp. ct3pR10 TaxID=2826284 RepID=A0A8S5LWI7_9CAUD|nr:MAG TPA: hypothetical protein [Siphoviridae sp. ct3pR10]
MSPLLCISLLSIVCSIHELCIAYRLYDKWDVIEKYLCLAEIARPPVPLKGRACRRSGACPLPVSTFMVLSHCVSVKVLFSHIRTMRVISRFISEI